MEYSYLVSTSAELLSALERPFLSAAKQLPVVSHVWQ
jgi:hypothetical protein